MNKTFWMSLVTLAILAMASPIQAQELRLAGSQNAVPAVTQAQCANGSCQSADDGYRMTVELLTTEALKVAAQLYQTGRITEAQHLLRKVQLLNPQSQQVRTALARITSTTGQTVQVTPAEVAAQLRGYQQATSASQQCQSGSCPTAPGAQPRSTGRIGVFATLPPQRISTNSQPQAIARDVVCVADCICEQTPRTQNKCCCGESCKCATANACKCVAAANACKCAANTVVVARPTAYRIISVPSEVVRHCPVLSGRIAVGHQTGTHKIIVRREATPAPRVYYLAIPVQQSAVTAQPHPVVEFRRVVHVTPTTRNVSYVETTTREAPNVITTQQAQFRNTSRAVIQVLANDNDGQPIYVAIPNPHVHRQVIYTPTDYQYAQPNR